MKNVQNGTSFNRGERRRVDVQDGATAPGGQQRGRRSVVVTSLGVSTKLLYVGPGLVMGWVTVFGG